MKRIIIGLFMLFTVFSVFATEIDFNNTNDLTNLFNNDGAPVCTASATGGIDNSGAVLFPTNTYEENLDVWTQNTGIVVPAVGQTITASVYFIMDGNAGYSGIGYATMNTNTINTYGRINTPGAYSLGMNFHSGAGSFLIIPAKVSFSD
ncbi:MAG: hypothetical protein JXR56_08785, partial [Candidatus Cloacimonetes bacterium]|nr:hypothetical protein [Candidatus Cloacimonadota bacterium]